MRRVALATGVPPASRVGFGLSAVHHIARSRDRQSLLAAAGDAGINYFDTAPYYGHGIGEAELGRYARGRRDRIVIATKFGIEPSAVARAVPPLMYGRLALYAALRRATGSSRFVVRPRRDYSAGNATRSLERSLRALGTDHVDVLLLHEPTLRMLTDPQALAVALERLCRAGKVRAVGVAGAAQQCVRIAAGYPALASLLQVDAAPGAAELAHVRAAGLRVGMSFGHFRGRAEPIGERLKAAVAANADGVILYSTRRPDRLAEIARLLGALEPA